MVADTTARLACTNIVREIVIKRTQLIGAIGTHPIATRARGYRKLDTGIDRSNSYLCVVFMSHGTRKKSK